MIKRTKRGITLIEMMVAVFISTIVLAAVYGVWMRVQRQIARSHAKQTLQNDLRAIANQMEKDFKAIKEGSFEAPPGEQSADGTSMHISFDRFVETEEGKIAQDSTMHVDYLLRNGMLIRTTDSSQKILSVNIDTLTLTKAVDEASLGATDLESTDEDFKAGREAKLDIAIAGKKRISGSVDEMYQIERTSLVMRDEYYRKTNKSYVSNFDLAKKNVDEVMVNDSSQDANFAPNAEYTEEMLSALDADQLRGMRATQEGILGQANDAFNQINDDINRTDCGVGGAGATADEVGAALFGWLGAEVEDSTLVFRMKERLKSAQNATDVVNVTQELESFAADKERDFYALAIPGYSSMSDEDKMLYKKAYDMKVQDRTIAKANDKMREENPDHQDIPNMIDTYTSAQSTEITDEQGTRTISADENQRNSDADEVRSAYDRITLDWMDDDDRKDEVEAYDAAKILISQARAKRDTIEMRDRSERNIALIDNALNRR